MARGKTSSGKSGIGSGGNGGYNDDDLEDEGQDGEVASGAAPAPTQSRLEEAWHGWLKPVGGIVLFVAAYLAYDYKLIPEGFGGRLLVALILGGTIFAVVAPALERVSVPKTRSLVAGLTAVWVIAAVAPIFRVAFWPAKTLAEARLTPNDKGDAIKQDIKLPDGETGPYELTVSGNLLGTGEAEAAYGFDVKGDSDATDHVEGAIRRTIFRERASRRSGATVAVKAVDDEQVHTLSRSLRGNKLSLEANVTAGSLENGLEVSVHSAPLPGWIFYFLGFLVFIGAVRFDYELIAPKQEKTYVAAAALFTLFFTLYYSGAIGRLSTDFPGATPHSLVRPAIGAGIFALLFGFLPGWAISSAVGSYKPRPKKLAGARP